MSRRVSRLASRTLALASGVLLSAAPAAAQRGGATSDAPSITTSTDTTWIVSRVPLARARESLRTQDAQAAVLLLDTTLVLQFTDEGLSRMKAGVRDSGPQGVGQRLIAQVVGSTLGTMFDHGIAYDLRGLRGARAEGSRLVLEDRAGERVFDRVELNGRDVMADFSPTEASRFAAAVNRALRR